MEFEALDNGGYGTDLACERRKSDLSSNGVEFSLSKGDEFSWERIRITDKEGERCIGRPMGIYDTLTLKRADLLSEEEINDAALEVADELSHIFSEIKITPKRLLVVGLGNASLTPDSIGPKTARLTNATMHIKELTGGAFCNEDFSEIAVIAPGVMADSGIESFDTVKGICDRIAPDALIAIDALASRSPSRLGATVQISDTGIFPGSGIGNRREGLSMATLGIPVIAIGVPTVINAEVFMNPEGRPIRGESGNEAMFVSPREIDTIAENCAKIISGGINRAFGII